MPSLNYSETLNTGEKLKLNIAQLPFATNDRWVGLPLKAWSEYARRETVAGRAVVQRRLT